MRFRNGLGQIAIALIGDNDGGTGLSDQKIGAGDPDISVDDFLPQHLARFVEQGTRFL